MFWIALRRREHKGGSSAHRKVPRAGQLGCFHELPFPHLDGLGVSRVWTTSAGLRVPELLSTRFRVVQVEPEAINASLSARLAARVDHDEVRAMSSESAVCGSLAARLRRPGSAALRPGCAQSASGCQCPGQGVSLPGSHGPPSHGGSFLLVNLTQVGVSLSRHL
eukprot:3173363-Rhodomonas_salina.4